jgi:hypothetical protein
MVPFYSAIGLADSLRNWSRVPMRPWTDILGYVMALSPHALLAFMILMIALFG